MQFRAIHQVLPNLTAEDAIGEYALLLQRIWQKWGLESRLYAERTNVPSAGALSLHRLPSRFSSDEAVVYHHSVGSQAAARFEAVQGAVRIVSYHNITPAHLLSSAPYMAARANLGLVQLESLARVAHLGIADSEFNRRDLVRAGFSRTAVVHLALSPERCRGLAEAAALRASRLACSAFPAAHPQFLHVGRVLPHKALHELLRIFAIYQSANGDSARLSIVGDMTEAPDYARYLHDLVEQRRISGVTFTGRVSVEQLFSEFATADLYFCTSRHEGFCVPLVECMFAGVPVLAVSAGAIEETAGRAAVVTAERDPYLLAEAATQILSDATLQKQIVAAQSARAAAYTEPALDARLRTVFSRIAAEVRPA